MKFTKMHGAGNDFVIINNIEEKLPLDIMPALAVKLCAFHTSVGADGMMLVVPAEKGGDYGMLFYNSDGSLGEMCGNGARCICRFGHDTGLAGVTQHVETTAGIVVGTRIDARRYRIRLNDPSVIDQHRHVTVDGTLFDCGYAELGDPGIPHAVVFLTDFDSFEKDELRRIGRTIRHAEVFPKGANVTFVKPVGDNELKAVTFERGVEDFTLACGTGCGSTVALLAMNGLVGDKDVLVHFPGGDLSISLTLDKAKGTVHDIFLTGPTNIVCRGEILDEDLII